MSLLGKILAFLNILGAAGFMAVATMNYTQRKVYAFRVQEYQFLINGLPIDAEQRDPQGRSLPEKIGPQMQKDLFGALPGQPVATQVEEVQNVQRLFDGKIESLGDKKKKIHFLARLLLPFTNNLVERERLQSQRFYLGDQGRFDLFKQGMERAFRTAIGQDEKPVEAAFRQAVKELGADPNQPQVTEFLGTLPDDPAKAKAAAFDATLEKSLDSQLAWLQARYRQLFDAALKGEEPVNGTSRKVYSDDARRIPIARLLVGLAPALAEEALSGASADPADKKLLQGAAVDSFLFQQNLVQTSAFQKAFTRTRVVVGVVVAGEVVTARSAVVRQLAEELTQRGLEDRIAFVESHQALLEEARERALLVEAELALLKNQTNLKTEQEALLKRRGLDLETYAGDKDKAVVGELEKAKQETAKALQALRQRTQDLFDLRIKLRDANKVNQDAEALIRKREKEIRELERNASPGGGNQP
jgi:hypothetical protein